jgi:Tol biopolymer transport system component
MALLMLTACRASASQMDSPVNPWPSLASSPVRFLTSGSQDLWPCFSPDGTHILFSRREGETWVLLLVPVASGQPQHLARSRLLVSATRANWSKQNNLIAFTGTSSHGENRIWVINSDGLSPREVESHGLSDQMFYPSWFPSGEQIAAMDAQDMVIKRVDINTGVAVTITDHKQVFTGMPSVSPDGRWVAFAGQKNTGQRYDQTKNSIWLVDDSGVAHTVESNPGQGRAPTWSPDGKLLAFESTRGSPNGLYSIFLINRDGTGLTQVTDPVLNADHPVWSPDGRQLAFSARASMWIKGRGIAIIDLPNNR